MELLQLKYFCSAAETENFSKTAQKYRVPVSNISQTVKRLEKELDVSLFVRQKNKITLSDEGRIFYEYAKEALLSLDEAKNKLSELDGKISGEIKILALANRRLVTKAIESFKALYPDTWFVLNHSTNADAKDFDIIIADDNFFAEGYTKSVLVEEDILLASKDDHPINSIKNVQPERLHGERFICMPEGSSLYTITNKICKDAGFLPDIVITTDDPYYVRKYVELGLGIAFVPSLSWKDEFSDKIALKNLNIPKRKTFLFTPTKTHPKKAVSAFCDMLLKESLTY